MTCPDLHQGELYNVLEVYRSEVYLPTHSLSSATIGLTGLQLPLRKWPALPWIQRRGYVLLAQRRRTRAVVERLVQTDKAQEENDRLDLYHHIQTLSLGGELHLAPIGDNPQRILDVGTGTGMYDSPT